MEILTLTARFVCVVVENQPMRNTVFAVLSGFGIPKILPERVKIYTEFNLVTLSRMVKFTELNIS